MKHHAMEDISSRLQILRHWADDYSLCYGCTVQLLLSIIICCHLPPPSSPPIRWWCTLQTSRKTPLRIVRWAMGVGRILAPVSDAVSTLYREVRMQWTKYRDWLCLLRLQHSVQSLVWCRGKVEVRDRHWSSILCTFHAVDNEEDAGYFVEVLQQDRDTNCLCRRDDLEPSYKVGHCWGGVLVRYQCRWVQGSKSSPFCWGVWQQKVDGCRFKSINVSTTCRKTS